MEVTIYLDATQVLLIIYNCTMCIVYCTIIVLLCISTYYVWYLSEIRSWYLGISYRLLDPNLENYCCSEFRLYCSHVSNSQLDLEVWIGLYICYETTNHVNNYCVIIYHICIICLTCSMTLTWWNVPRTVKPTIVYTAMSTNPRKVSLSPNI